jgi:2-methylaconitate cis-trans-isomerase PrpF
MRPQCGFGGADRRRFVMFKPYVNHAAQYVADAGGVADAGSFPNILHLNAHSLHRSVNITKSVEITTRFYSGKIVFIRFTQRARRFQRVQINKCAEVC